MAILFNILNKISPCFAASKYMCLVRFYSKVNMQMDFQEQHLLAKIRFFIFKTLFQNFKIMLHKNVNMSPKKFFHC